MALGEKKRSVALVNLLVGILAGGLLIMVVELGRDGLGAPAVGTFCGVLAVLLWRVHRVFEVIED